MGELQGVVPMIAYRDCQTAIEWLATAFGFKETMRIESGGRISHCELETGYGHVMLASPTPEYEGPTLHRRHCSSTDSWLSVPWVVDGVLVYVDDVDAHFSRAAAAGAECCRHPSPGLQLAATACRILRAIAGCSWSGQPLSVAAQSVPVAPHADVISTK
jgi:uncharacterized glyoxalase superfamily protein PhnB